MKNKKSKKKGQDFEEKVQKCLNSGALIFDKGDLKTDEIIIECKYTEKLSYRITNKTLEKLWTDALENNKLPKLVIGIPRNEKEMFIISCNVEVHKK